MSRRKRARPKDNYVKHHDIVLRKAAVMMLDCVADTSFALAKEKYSKKVARERQEAAAKKVVRTFGAGSAIESVLLYRRLLFNNTKNRTIRMRLNDPNSKVREETVPIYTYGIDEYFKKRWPDKWSEMVAREKKTRPKKVAPTIKTVKKKSSLSSIRGES